jgi:hypothetical protein
MGDRVHWLSSRLGHRWTSTVFHRNRLPFHRLNPRFFSVRMLSAAAVRGMGKRYNLHSELIGLHKNAR